MKIERAILVAFLGNYVINNVVAAFVALIPPSATPGVLTPQYISFVIAAAVFVGILSWWYGKGRLDLKAGIIFGVVGFVVAVATAFVSGISGVMLQTGSFTQVMNVLPNFWPFLANPSTLVLAGYWIIPSVALGWWLGRSANPAGDVPRPIF